MKQIKRQLFSDFHDKMLVDFLITRRFRLRLQKKIIERSRHSIVFETWRHLEEFQR